MYIFLNFRIYQIVFSDSRLKRSLNRTSVKNSAMGTLTFSNIPGISSTVKNVEIFFRKLNYFDISGPVRKTKGMQLSAKVIYCKRLESCFLLFINNIDTV